VPPTDVPSLPRSTPSAQGVDPAGVAAFLDAVDAAPDVELHGVVVVRHGHVVAEGWWHPYTPDRVHLLYSLSKSFASAAAGFAVAEGLLDLDASVLSYFPELEGAVTDPRSRAMRVRDVAAMASGHLAETADEAFAADDPILGFLTIPPDRDPGTVFAYNQPCTYALAAIVQRLTGGTLTDYLRPRLFEPLGIVPGGWQQHPAGREIGYSGLHLTTEDAARFGQCLLDDGRWQGRQVLPTGWVAEATREHVPTVGSAGEAVVEARDGDWAQGYGQQFWRSRHGYRGDGAYGQFCVVVPEVDLVVATTGASPDMQAVLDAVWAHVLPALADAPLPSSAADDDLARRLATLGLPAVPQGAADDVPAGTRLRLTDATGLRGITGAVLRRDATGWTLALDAWDGHAVAGAGPVGWAVTEPADGAAPLAVSVGADVPGRVRADVLLLETPHRLLLDGDLAAGTLTATWATEPLGGVSLRSMAPR
jgi:CubicO group peptidase (beta-lactamase class C family)